MGTDTPPRRRRLLLVIGGATLLVVAAVPTLFVALQPVQVLPRLGLAPGFSLVDQRGERLTSDDLRGGITLYAVAYGRCGARCEPVAARMREVYARLDDEAVDPDIPVRLVSISLDPDGDDPAELAAREAVPPDPDLWRFATADTAHLRDVVGTGLETWHARDADGTITFDPTLVLVDQLGVKRAVFRYSIPDPDRLVLHLREMTKEARATGMAHLAYEAAHLFACYTPY